jgi:hypothetical protein
LAINIWRSKQIPALVPHTSSSDGWQPRSCLTVRGFSGSWDGSALRQRYDMRLRSAAHLAYHIGEFPHLGDAGPDRLGQTGSAVLEIAAGDLALLVDCEGGVIRERDLYQLSTPAPLVRQLKLRRQGLGHRQNLFDSR